MRIASIDIGTNTILLLIADISKDGITNVIHDEQVIARLGKGVDADRMINQETFLRAESFLRTYKERCDSFAVDQIAAVGTSALRDAKNSDEFCNFITKNTGMSIEVISGEEEALWTYRGGISEFVDRADKFSVLDIGGGSTEIIVGNAFNVESKTSINIGSVRITERILRTSPPDDAALIEAYELIRSQIPLDLAQQLTSTFAVGVAGTLTTLAALHQNLPHYDPAKVNGYSLLYEDIGVMFAMLKDKSIGQIKRFPQISEGRADIILAGIMILIGCMERAQLKSITVSDRGLRYGVLYREINRLFH
ncbi:MAG: Ppx/GppA family phosphatase [Ignavibacteriales bacterium]|nr:Ppx/GppA family phosphatase [Ignavibacteriales bacterium]